MSDVEFELRAAHHRETARTWTDLWRPKMNKETGWCADCWYDWPCPTVRFLDEAKALRERVRMLESARIYNDPVYAKIETLRQMLQRALVGGEPREVAKSLIIEIAGREEIMREALLFYSEEDSYIPAKSGDGGYDLPVVADGGLKARRALERIRA